MSYDGSHVLCEKHKKQKVYCSIDQEWQCFDCELEKQEKT